MELHPGEVIDRYQVVDVLGKGGMAVVYKAVHDTLGSMHAIKVLSVPSEDQKIRLMAEGKVQATLRHPNLVAVTDVMEVNGSPALVMEFVDGPTLDEWLNEYTPTLEESLGVFRGVLRGIDVAHKAGRVHRDLKPGNIMLARTPDGVIPKITDFGLVKRLEYRKSRPDSITKQGVGMGTAGYMAPEQIRDATDVDARADLFALGCILYDLVTGQRAFEGPDSFSIMQKVMAGDYKAPHDLVPDLPPEVSTTIRRMLYHDREERPDDCDDVRHLLWGETRRMPTEDYVVAIGANPPSRVRPAEQLSQPSIIKDVANPSMEQVTDALQPSSREWLLPVGLAAVAVVLVLVLVVLAYVLFTLA